MAYPATKTLADWTVNCQLVDVSTASIAYVCTGAPGRLQRAYVCISAAVTSADATVTIKKNSTSIGTITIAYSGSAAGSIFEATFTGSEADRFFQPTDTLVFDSDGGSSTTSIGVFTALMRGL